MSYESLTGEPEKTTGKIFTWLDLPPCSIDTEALQLGETESDSHYRMKFPHRLSKGVHMRSQQRTIPEHIEEKILSENVWFYDEFYPKYNQTS